MSLGAERYHHGDLRRALLGAALEILEEGEEPSLRGVARRAGVSHAAPYHHFADRRALVAAIAAEGLRALRDAEAAGVVGAGPDPSRQLRATGVAYVRFAVARPALFRLMFSAALADRDDLPELQAAYAGAYDAMVDCWRAMLGPAASPEQIRLRALASWSVVHGLANLLLDRQVQGRAWTPDEAAALAEQVLGGMPAK